MKLLVCGGRHWGVIPPDTDHTDPEVVEIVKLQARREAFILRDALDTLHDDHGIDTIVHGYASGADTHAMEWAGDNRVPAIGYMARWAKEGRAAGPIRNQRMLDEQRPDMVVAFPGGSGTADMVARARRGGFLVTRVGHGQELPPAWFIAKHSGPNGSGSPQTAMSLR